MQKNAKLVRVDGSFVICYARVKFLMYTTKLTLFKPAIKIDSALTLSFKYSASTPDSGKPHIAVIPLMIVIYHLFWRDMFS